MRRFGFGNHLVMRCFLCVFFCFSQDAYLQLRRGYLNNSREGDLFQCESLFQVDSVRLKFAASAVKIAQARNSPILNKPDSKSDLLKMSIGMESISAFTSAYGALDELQARLMSEGAGISEEISDWCQSMRSHAEQCGHRLQILEPRRLLALNRCGQRPQI